MLIETLRLRLDRHQSENAHLLHKWRNDLEIADLSTDAPLAVTTLEDEQKRIERWTLDSEDQRHFAIFKRDNGEYIGFCHVVMIDYHNRNCRIGIVIGERQCWNLGYGTEVMHALTKFCFDDLALHRITCETYSHNIRAWRMLEAAGFVREGVLRQQIRRGEDWCDEYVYGLIINAGGR